MITMQTPAAPPPFLYSSEDHLLDAMEDELRLAYKMVQELKNAPRASPRKRHKPCCFCSNATQRAEQQNLLMNASVDMSPDPFGTPPPLRSNARSSTNLFTPRRPSRPLNHVSQRLFDVKMETPSNPDGLMMAVDKFLASGDFLP